MENRIAVLRKERSLTLEDVAQGAGTTRSQIQKLENGDRRLTLEWMQRLAKVFGVDVADLLPDQNRVSDAAERELLSIAANLPPAERDTLVRVARELLGTVRRSTRAISRTKRPLRK